MSLPPFALGASQNVINDTWHDPLNIAAGLPELPIHLGGGGVSGYMYQTPVGGGGGFRPIQHHQSQPYNPTFGEPISPHLIASAPPAPFTPGGQSIAQYSSDASAPPDEPPNPLMQQQAPGGGGEPGYQPGGAQTVEGESSTPPGVPFGRMMSEGQPTALRLTDEISQLKQQVQMMQMGRAIQLQQMINAPTSPGPQYYPFPMQMQMAKQNGTYYNNLPQAAQAVAAGHPPNYHPWKQLGNNLKASIYATNPNIQRQELTPYVMEQARINENLKNMRTIAPSMLAGGHQDIGDLQQQIRQKQGELFQVYLTEYKEMRKSQGGKTTPYQTYQMISKAYSLTPDPPGEKGKKYAWAEEVKQATGVDLHKLDHIQDFRAAEQVEFLQAKVGQFEAMSPDKVATVKANAVIAKARAAHINEALGAQIDMTKTSAERAHLALAIDKEFKKPYMDLRMQLTKAQLHNAQMLPEWRELEAQLKENWVESQLYSEWSRSLGGPTQAVLANRIKELTGKEPSQGVGERTKERFGTIEDLVQKISNSVKSGGMPPAGAAETAKPAPGASMVPPPPPTVPTAPGSGFQQASSQELRDLAMELGWDGKGKPTQAIIDKGERILNRLGKTGHSR